MVKLDRIKLTIPANSCTLKGNYFGLRNKREAMPPGLSPPYKNNGNVTFEVTGKILGADCNRLITKATIYDVWESLNATEWLSIPDYERFAAAPVVLCDVTEDIQYGAISRAIEGLAAASSAGRNGWNASEPRRNRQRRFTSVSFTSRCVSRTKQRYLTAYDKYAELSKQGEFLDTLPPPEREKVLSDSRGVFRFELSLNRVGQIKDAFGTKDIALSNLLNSKKNPVLATMEKIIRNAPAPTEGAAKENLKTLQMTRVLQAYDNNIGALTADFKATDPKNYARAVVPYKALYARLVTSAEAVGLRQQLISAISNAA